MLIVGPLGGAAQWKKNTHLGWEGKALIPRRRIKRWQVIKDMYKLMLIVGLDKNQLKLAT